MIMLCQHIRQEEGLVSTWLVSPMLIQARFCRGHMGRVSHSETQNKYSKREPNSAEKENHVTIHDDVVLCVLLSSQQITLYWKRL